MEQQILSTVENSHETSTDETPKDHWFGVHRGWVMFGVTMGLFTGAVVYHALSTANLMCIEYPNMFRSLIFAPSVAGFGGLFAGTSVIVFWWMMGFVYETCNAMRIAHYDEDFDDEESD